LDAETSSRIELKVLAEDDFANAVHGRTKEVLGIRNIFILKIYKNKSKNIKNILLIRENLDFFLFQKFYSEFF
jgi:hypothetical protein